jgi:hAT family C-terminal dimerisation region
LEDLEEGNWVPKTKGRIQDFWASEYKNKIVKESRSQPEASAHPSDQNAPDVFQKFLYKRPFSTSLDEYSTYCDTNPLQEAPANPIRHWDGQAFGSPSLSQMALDLLSIPAIAAECERVFSSSKILISDHRNSLSDDIIEANECVRHWVKKGYFD